MEDIPGSLGSDDSPLSDESWVKVSVLDVQNSVVDNKFSSSCPITVKAPGSIQSVPEGLVILCKDPNMDLERLAALLGSVLISFQDSRPGYQTLHPTRRWSGTDVAKKGKRRCESAALNHIVHKSREERAKLDPKERGALIDRMTKGLPEKNQFKLLDVVKFNKA